MDTNVENGSLQSIRKILLEGSKIGTFQCLMLFQSPLHGKQWVRANSDLLVDDLRASLLRAENELVFGSGAVVYLRDLLSDPDFSRLSGCEFDCICVFTDRAAILSNEGMVAKLKTLCRSDISEIPAKIVFIHGR